MAVDLLGSVGGEVLGLQRRRASEQRNRKTHLVALRLNTVHILKHALRVDNPTYNVGKQFLSSPIACMVLSI